MRKGMKNRPVKLNNTGSAIVTVIVVVTFISILATTILYMSNMNLFMKTTDLRAKQSFYEGEVALEEIKAALMEEASEACEAAYKEVLLNYAALDEGTKYVLFQNKFLEVLKEKWKDRVADPSEPNYLKVLQDIVDGEYKTAISLESVENAGNVVIDSTRGCAFVRGVTLTYTDAAGYTTVISTDYLIKVPDMNWDLTSDSAVRNDVEISECVQYYNWVKK
ncbi:MAG: hypothetical protein HDQ99_08950 [Lachnospiraceae bacterium]|nr:hypothetical protein [Lachnospiraceae bacterium]